MKPLHILAVDDSPSFREYLGEILRGDGHVVALAASGEEAIEHCRAQKPDLILMDRIMTGIDGLQAIREIRKIPCAAWVPIILVTTSMDDGDVLEAFMAGADEFLLKPLNPLHLQIRLQSVMRIAAIQHATTAVIDTLIDGIVRIDSAGTISMFNPSAERIFGYAANEVIGRNVSMLMPSPDRERHDSYIANFNATGQAKIIGSGRKVLGQRGNGETFPMHLGITQASTPDGRYFIGLVRDLTKEEELLREVEHLATHDSLTGLPNRLNCWTHLSKRYADPAGPVPFTVFYCDLDGFKNVNDTAGHAAGDAILVEAAKRIRSALFVRDFLGRLGGDEFLIVVDGELGDAEAEAVGDHVIAKMRAPIPTSFGEMRIGATLGYAHSRSHPASVEVLMHAADEAMYQAKRAGRGRIFGAPKPTVEHS